MEKLSTSKDIAENKLLILYVLSKIDIEIGNIPLTNYLLGQRLMDFLAFQQRINELIESGHVGSAKKDDKISYSITEKGSELLSLMSGLLPETEKNRVDRTHRSLRREMINKRAVTAYFTPEDEYRNVVHIELNEGELSMLSLDIAAASKAEAAAMCENWKTDTVDIYAKLIELLLRK
jgi:predicted transcriptional regulator